MQCVQYDILLLDSCACTAETLKGVPTINENMATIQYNIEVTTAPLAMAGTGGDVKVVLHGEKGSTDELLLNSFLYDDFEPGATNTFQVDAMDVGRVMYMTVRLSKDPVGLVVVAAAVAGNFLGVSDHLQQHMFRITCACLEYKQSSSQRLHAPGAVTCFSISLTWLKCGAGF